MCYLRLPKTKIVEGGRRLFVFIILSAIGNKEMLLKNKTKHRDRGNRNGKQTTYI